MPAVVSHRRRYRWARRPKVNRGHCRDYARPALVLHWEFEELLRCYSWSSCPEGDGARSCRRVAPLPGFRGAVCGNGGMENIWLASALWTGLALAPVRKRKPTAISPWACATMCFRRCRPRRRRERARPLLRAASPSRAGCGRALWCGAEFGVGDRQQPSPQPALALNSAINASQAGAACLSSLQKP